MDFYYGTANNQRSLYHKGTKGMKWGYNDGRRNGKRTAGEGESYLDMLERAGDTPTQYEYNGKTYKLTDYESYAGGGSRAQYTNGNHKIWVGDGSSWKDRSMTSIGGDTKVTQIEKGKLTRYKEKVKKWINSLTDKKVTVTSNGHKSSYVEKGSISKSIDKGKKRVNKILSKIKKKVSNIGKKPKAKITTSSIRYDKYN